MGQTPNRLGPGDIERQVVAFLEPWQLGILQKFLVPELDHWDRLTLIANVLVDVKICLDSDDMRAAFAEDFVTGRVG